MIGLVVVSHSAALASAALEFALLMAPDDRPNIAIAAGAASNDFGTSARRIVEGIVEVASPEGVLLLVDLGSAVLNAQMAVELLGDTHYAVRVSEAPFVEGLTAAIATAATGASLEEVDTEARRAGTTKGEPLEARRTDTWNESDDTSTATTTCRIVADHGLHARPAARIVDVVADFAAQVRIRNKSTAGSFVSATSITELMTLGAAPGDIVIVEASGPDASAAVAAVVAIAAQDTATPRTVKANARQVTSLVAGIGVGKAVRSHSEASAWDLANYQTRSPKEEQQRLDDARTQATAQLDSLGRDKRSALPTDSLAIIHSWTAILNDQALLAPIKNDIAQGMGALQAWTNSFANVLERIRGLSDPYQRQRAADLADIRDRVAAELVSRSSSTTQPVTGILLLDDLSPTHISRLDPDRCQGIIATHGSTTSHAAILARSLGIPTVVGVGPAVLDELAGHVVLLDATTPKIIVDPTTSDVQAATPDVAGRQFPIIATPARTSDGRQIDVGAAIASITQAADAYRMGADSIGLLRTEFLFQHHRTAPSIEEQVAAYEAIAEQMGGRTLTIRTFDSAPDKPLWFLGGGLTGDACGLAVTLAYPEILHDQLQAIHQVSKNYPVRIVFPHVTNHHQLTDALEILATARGSDDPNVHSVGAMVEDPVVLADLDHIATLCDFIAIGTNDLATRLRGTTRRDPTPPSATLTPDLLRTIAAISRAASMRRVEACGELAADTDAIALLIGLGIRALSVHPAAIPATKAVVAEWAADETALRHLAATTRTSTHTKD